MSAIRRKEVFKNLWMVLCKEQKIIGKALGGRWLLDNIHSERKGIDFFFGTAIMLMSIDNEILNIQSTTEDRRATADRQTTD